LAADAQKTDAPKTSIGPDDGYRGIWYYNQKLDNEYKYKYSGGLGTYCAKHIPMAYYSAKADKTFFVYGGTVKGKNELLEMVSYYDHRTGLLPRPTILMNKKTGDAHDNPTIMLDDDGFVWVFASSHGTGRPSFIFKSDMPFSTTSFTVVRKTNFSYPQPWHIPNSGFLFLQTIYIEGHRVLHWATSQDGVQWNKPIQLAHIAAGHYQISWRHGTKIGTALNYHPAGKGLNWRTNLYYLETDNYGESWKNARGERLATPLTEINNAALVHDYESDKRLVYLKDVKFDANGDPIILYVTSNGYASGPENDPRTWTVAHRQNKSWNIREITNSDNNYDAGCLRIESDGTWLLIGPTETGPQPYNPGGEMAMWISSDSGTTWKKTAQITNKSEFNHTYARPPVNAHPDFAAFWADGHGRQPSESRLYFCDRTGMNVFMMPYKMDKPFEKPVRVK
jgi:hypothetical protein